jgi:hypothetical protein
VLAGTSVERPIIIVGISRRSGTNFLSSVLLCHRDCAAPAAPVAEDHLLRDATALRRYARRTARRWPRRWGDREEAQAALERALGTGLLVFLTSRTDGRRTVSRTPHTDNLALVPSLYAGADVVLLVRDGRSVVASLMHAWGWSLDEAAREWRRGARDILAMQRSLVAGEIDARVHVVRYEDLVARFEPTIDELLDFTGLDPAGFDRTKAADLPILGSSFIRDGAGRLTWEPVDKTADFEPANRFAQWSPSRRARFDWLAGEEQQALGYPLATVDPESSRPVFRQRAHDLGWAMTGWLLVGRRRVRNWVRERLADRRWHAARSTGGRTERSVSPSP